MKIKQVKTDYAYVVFDGENKLHRREIDSGYKASRTDYSKVSEEDNPYSQLDKIKSVLSYLKIAFFETHDSEADDEIAGIVKNYKDKLEIVISSQDKDLFQLVCDNVSVFSYRGKLSTLWDKDAFTQKFGFEPCYYNSFKALVGDPSDNIKGVKGVGMKTATLLISQFGSIENMLENVHNIQNERLKSIILDNSSHIIRNFKIVDLHQAEEKSCKFSPVLQSIFDKSVIEILTLLGLF